MADYRIVYMGATDDKPTHIVISAEQAALEELSQEEQDAVVCLRAGRFELYEEKPFTSNWIVHSEKSSHSRPTRPEALRALAKALKEREADG